MLRPAALYCLPLALLLAAPLVTAQEEPLIVVVNGGPVGPGDEFSIFGNDLGSKKPKVSLGDVDGNKVKGARVKVLELLVDEVTEAEASHELRCRLVKAPLGVHFPIVKVKGFDPVVSAEALEVRGPLVMTVASVGEDATPTFDTQDEALLFVGWAGSTKGRVYVGDRKAKVLEQVPGGEMPHVKAVTVRLPKQADGFFDVSFENKLSRGFRHLALNQTGEAKGKLGKPALAWVVDGAPRVLKARGKRWAGEVVGEDLVLTARSKKKGVTHELELLFPTSAVDAALPTTLPELDVLVTYTRTSKAGTSVFKAGGADEAVAFAQIHLGAQHGGRIAGSVHALLDYQSGPDDELFPRLDGSFIFEIPDELLLMAN